MIKCKSILSKVRAAIIVLKIQMKNKKINLKNGKSKLNFLEKKIYLTLVKLKLKIYSNKLRITSGGLPEMDCTNLLFLYLQIIGLCNEIGNL